MKALTVIGVMSGTSLDGLDLVCCTFSNYNNQWNYSLQAATTIPYNEVWLKRLSNLHKQPMFVLPKTDAFYGKYIGQCINSFIKQNNIQPNLIASHGHTIFHNPAENYTTQIGSGAAIYAETGIATVCDFRSVDVALGGQGAPLVPLGDELLFYNYNCFLNLGGFANISYTSAGVRKAFDICACNIVLNQIAHTLGLPFDDSGNVARSGNIDEQLLNELNALPYYQKLGAKSLGREWVEQNIFPIFYKYTASPEDLLCTFCEHAAIQIGPTLHQQTLVTGGGAYNQFLIERIQAYAKASLHIPKDNIIQFKEAIIFAFLGVLNISGINNALTSVTQAKQSSIGGALYGKSPI
jgi:anhydro-N-acetylmuramic acid kinase